MTGYDNDESREDECLLQKDYTKQQIGLLSLLYISMLFIVFHARSRNGAMTEDYV